MMARRLALAVVLLGLGTLPAGAQRYYDNGRNAPSHYEAKYDGQFAFVRLYYDRYPGWSYDYPEMGRRAASLLLAIVDGRDGARNAEVPATVTARRSTERG